MRLSYVILSHNRRDALLRNLAQLPSLTPLPENQWEIWVVDDASKDGTIEAVQRDFPHVNLIRNEVNQGVAAQNHAFTRCGGEYILSLDEASYPVEPRNVSLMIAHLNAHSSVGAVVGKTIGPDGSSSGPAMPSMLMSGATAFRRSALLKVGGFRFELRGAAAELDLSCRLWQAGARIDRREDITFAHDLMDDSDAKALSPAAARQIELRNWLIVAQRFLPHPLRRIYWQDFRLRYEALARHGGGIGDIEWGIWGARMWSARDALFGRMELSEEAIENVFGLRQAAIKVGDWARRNSTWRVVLADFGENMWATYNACRASGLQLRCIADENSAFDGLEYRGLPIVSAHRAFEGGGIDGVVIANMNPAEIEMRVKAIRRSFKGPILRLWEPPRLATQVRPVAIAA
ncbi:MAG: glycosyltransferase [Planctomycetota bacterium]|nr:glycosyltransferase [Planctomycetota bacterium]